MVGPAVPRMFKHSSRIDRLISKAALSSSFSPLSESAEEDWEATLGCGGGLYVYSSNMSAKIYAVPNVGCHVSRSSFTSSIIESDGLPRSVRASSVVTISPLLIIVTLAIYRWAIDSMSPTD